MIHTQAKMFLGISASLVEVNPTDVVSVVYAFDCQRAGVAIWAQGAQGSEGQIVNVYCLND